MKSCSRLNNAQEHCEARLEFLIAQVAALLQSNPIRQARGVEIQSPVRRPSDEIVGAPQDDVTQELPTSNHCRCCSPPAPTRNRARSNNMISTASAAVPFQLSKIKRMLEYLWLCIQECSILMRSCTTYRRFVTVFVADDIIALFSTYRLRLQSWVA